MNLEGRKNNTYYDKTGLQILVGDLLKIFHFKNGKKVQYMYHVVVMEETPDFPVMAAREYISDKPHYRLYVLCDNEQRVYKDAKIIKDWDWRSKRKRITIAKNVPANEG